METEDRLGSGGSLSLSDEAPACTAAAVDSQKRCLHYSGLTLKALRLASHDSHGDLNSFALVGREGLEPKKSSPVPELRKRQSRSLAVT